MSPNPEIDQALCLTEEQKARHRYTLVERFLRLEFRRFDLRQREQSVADTILDMSFGLGLRSVRIPKYETLSDITGIAIPNVYNAVKALVEMNILSIEDVDGAHIYTLIANPDEWRCRARISRARVNDAVNVLKHYNGLGEKLAPGVLDAITSGPHSEEKGTPENFNNHQSTRALQVDFMDLINFSPVKSSFVPAL